MKAYIHAFQGKPWNEDCEAAYHGFKRLGIEPVLFTCNKDLEQRKPEDIVVGGMLIMGHVFEQAGIIPDKYDYPEELSGYLDRKIRRIRLKDLQRQVCPAFVKPVEEKAAKGIVIKTPADWEEYERVLDPEAELYCSDVVDFVSEWRCFVRYGQIIGVQRYCGDATHQYDRTVVKKAVAEYSSIPAACALDFGVTKDRRTLLIEVNDGFAIGAYGLPDFQYAAFLEARWAELTRTEDPWKDKKQIVSVLERLEIKEMGILCYFHVPLGAAKEIFQKGDIWENQKGTEYRVRGVYELTNCWYNPSDSVCVILRTPEGNSPEREEVLYKKAKESIEGDAI